MKTYQYLITIVLDRKMLCYSFIVLLYFTNFGVKHGYVPRRSLYLRTSTSRNYGCITNHKHNYFSNKQNLSSKKFQLFSSTDKAENGVTIRSLVDHQLDGRYLKESVIKWLDEEWIAQEVHKKLGEEVERIYVSNREKGVSDLGEIVMNTGTAFESFDLGDAYVNSWDIANKVSDFLMVRLDREVCCSGDLSAFKELSDSMEGIDANGDTIIKMITPKKAHFPPILVDTKELQTASRVLESEFARYKLMKDFLDGKKYNSLYSFRCLDPSLLNNR